MDERIFCEEHGESERYRGGRGAEDAKNRALGELQNVSMEWQRAEENYDSLINKSDEIEKNRENRLSQNSLRPKKVVCVEEKLNENFTLKELQEIAKSAASNKFIGNSEEYYFVNNPKEVIKIALEKKGYKNSTITYKNRSNNCSGTSDFTIRYISSKGHFQLGDSKGNLLWEPYKYNNPANSFSGTASKYNEVSIILGVKE